MARVIDLKTVKQEEPLKKSEPPIVHPVVQEQKIINDSGERLPYQTLRWIAPASYKQEGARAPYYFVGFLALLAILAAVVQRDWILTVLLGLMAIMAFVHVRKPLSYIAIEITPLNVRIDDRNYSYDTLKSFWIQYEPEFGIRELSFQFKKWHTPFLKVQIGEQDPVQIRSILIQFIPEVEHEETFVHTLVRRLGL